MTQSVHLAQGVAHVFVAVDHPKRDCVSVQVDKSANPFQALESLRKGMWRHCGAIGKDVSAGLMLRRDHGPNYMSNEIAFLGIEASLSFVRQADGNGFGERFIRTLKANHFDTIEALRLALLEFGTRYNTHWLVTGHCYRRSEPTSRAPWARPRCSPYVERQKRSVATC